MKYLVLLLPLFCTGCCILNPIECGHASNPFYIGEPKGSYHSDHANDYSVGSENNFRKVLTFEYVGNKPTD